jgi:apolipoprotein N-acyltransferase
MTSPSGSAAASASLQDLTNVSAATQHVSQTSEMAADTQAEDAAPRGVGGTGPWRGRILRGVAAIAAGLLLVLSFPPYDDLWFLAPVGVAVLALAAHRRSAWFGALLGLLAGLALLIPLLRWAGGFVGPVWLILPVGEAAYVALLGALSALTSPVVDRWRWTWPIATGSLWVLQEALRDRTPFGGFPWGRLAFSQGDSPLLRLAALGGAPLVTFAVGALGGALAWAVLAVRGAVSAANGGVSPAIGGLRRTGAATGAIALFALSPAVVSAPLTAAPGGDHVRVAVIQGNVPRLGLEFNAQRRAVLDNHVNATLALAADVAAGKAQRPDIVIWPENSSDIDPIVNPDATRRINEAATAIGVPILVGGLLDPTTQGQGLRNVGLVWEPGRGPTQTYVKQHPVPFAEYIPIRSFARLISDKVDLVQTDFVAGPSPGILHMGPVTVGDVICFEVAYDNIPRAVVTGGAQLLVVQTNNATFDEAEARQQLAMVRLRAVELGRPAVMASTVGVSAFVDPAGTVYDATRFDVPALIERDLTLSSTHTVATSVGEIPEIALVVVALGLVLTGVVTRWKRREVVR